MLARAQLRHTAVGVTGRIEGPRGHESRSRIPRRDSGRIAWRKENRANLFLYRGRRRCLTRLPPPGKKDCPCAVRDVGGSFNLIHAKGAVIEGGVHAPLRRGSLKPSTISAPTWLLPGSKHRGTRQRWGSLI